MKLWLVRFYNTDGTIDQYTYINKVGAQKHFDLYTEFNDEECSNYEKIELIENTNMKDQIIGCICR